MVSPGWSPRRPPGGGQTARLSISLAVSLAAHTALLSLAPGRPAWLQAGRDATETRPPLVVALPATRESAAVQIVPAVRPAPPQPDALRPTAMPIRPEKEPIARHAAPEQPAAPAGNSSPTGMFPGPWYYPARYLHRRPTPLKPIWPDYPAEHEKIRGRVVILLLIDEQGKVDQHRIESADPPGVFDDSVIRAFTAAAYAPALITGYQVKSQLLAEVFFEPGAPPRANFSIMENAVPIQGPASSFGKGN